MLRTITLRNLRAHPVRFVATMLAVFVATGFLATALILRDSVAGTIEANTVAGLAGVDVVVQPDPDTAEEMLQQTPLVPVEVLEAVRDTDGVGGADGTLSGTIAILDGTKLRAVGYRRIGPDALNPFVAAEGRLPERSGEIAVDAETGAEIAERVGTTGSGVGAEIAVATAVGEQRATVVGISRFGEAARRDGQPNVVVSQDDAFDWLSGGTEGYAAVLAATPGADPAQVAPAVERSIAGLESTTPMLVMTGDAYRATQAGDAADISNAIGVALQVFAYVALFVGIFIIYNTFTIVVAQRQRELALLRAIGADGRQVRRSVLFESLVVGITASALGYLLGIVVVLALALAFPGLLSLGSSDEVRLSVGVWGIAQVLISGTVVTVVSAFIPAFRAARISPLEAMRATAVEAQRASRPRMLAGFVFGTIGVLTMLAAVGTKQGLMLAPGPPLLFLAAILLGPAIVATIARGLERIAARRPTLKLAAANLARSPRRAATTANALVIGVFLVVFATAAGGAIRDYAVAQIESLGGADLLVGTTAAELDPQLIADIEATPGVANAAPVYLGFANVQIVVPGQAGGEPLPLYVTGTDLPGGGSALGLEALAGSLAELGTDELALMSDIADLAQLSIGDPIEVVYADGTSHRFTVGAITNRNLFALATVDTAVVEEAAPDLRPANLAVQVEPGRIDEVQAQVDRLIEPYSTVEVLPGNAIAGFFKAFFNAMISAVNGLLAIAVVVAVFGIVNTLLLAVVERTHELGLLRAVGMSRAQVRATVRAEALLISIVGTFVGMACGMFVAATVTVVILADDGGGFTWPGRELALIAVLGVLVGLLAAIIPARRAAKLGILESIAYE